MSTVELAREELGGGPHLAVFLHGILGSGVNLRTLARRYVSARPERRAWLVDLRGHGRSPKGSPEPSVSACAQDLAAACAGAGVEVLVGHSFGGKVALAMLALPAFATVGHVVSLDSPPGKRELPDDGPPDSAKGLLRLIGRLPAIFPSRAAFTEAVMAAGHPRGLAQWLAQSTVSGPGGVRFGLDAGEIRALLDDYARLDLWPVVDAAAAQVHFVIGARSAAWSEDERRRALSRGDRVTVDVLPADHWVHADDPDGVLRVLLERT